MQGLEGIEIWKEMIGGRRGFGPLLRGREGFAFLSCQHAWSVRFIIIIHQPELIDQNRENEKKRARVQGEQVPISRYQSAG